MGKVISDKPARLVPHPKRRLQQHRRNQHADYNRYHGQNLAFSRLITSQLNAKNIPNVRIRLTDWDKDLILWGQVQPFALCRSQSYPCSPMSLHPLCFIEPCLPMISRTVPTGAGWAYEIKHDGFRFICQQSPPQSSHPSGPPMTLGNITRWACITPSALGSFPRATDLLTL